MPRSIRNPRIWVYDRRALPDKARAHAVERQESGLLGCLDRDEVHGRPLHGLGIAEVVLVSTQKRLEVLGEHHADIVPERLNLARDAMRARACLQAKKAT